MEKFEDKQPSLEQQRALLKKVLAENNQAINSSPLGAKIKNRRSLKDAPDLVFYLSATPGDSINNPTSGVSKSTDIGVLVAKPKMDDGEIVGYEAVDNILIANIGDDGQEWLLDPRVAISEVAGVDEMDEYDLRMLREMYDELRAMKISGQLPDLGDNLHSLKEHSA